MYTRSVCYQKKGFLQFKQSLQLKVKMVAFLLKSLLIRVELFQYIQYSALRIIGMIIMMRTDNMVLVSVVPTWGNAKGVEPRMN